MNNKNDKVLERNYNIDNDYNIDDDSDLIENNDLLGYDIAVFYNTYNLSVLMDWINKEKLVVPEFQRSYVWDIKQASSFVDSLLRELPVPSFFIYDDRDNGKYLIVDGQQRLKSLYKYMKEQKFNGKEFKLIGESIHQKWVNKTFDELGDYKDKLNDTLLNVTTVRAVGKNNDRTSLYIIFQRLNTGGTPLNAQEIRMSISYGELARFIDDISCNELFDRWLFLRTDKDRRGANYYRVQEFLLKVFAYYFEFTNNRLSGGSIRSFLDTFFDNEKDFELPKQKKGGIVYYSKSEFEKVYNIIESVVKNIEQDDITFGEKPIPSFVIAVLIGIINYYIRVNSKARIDYKKIKDAIKKFKDKDDFEAIFQIRRTSLDTIKSQVEISINHFIEVFDGKA